MLKQVNKLATCRSGSVVVVAAFFMLVAVAMGAIVIDLGSFFYQKRRLQSATDLAAISAAANMGNAQAAATATLALNGFSASTLGSIQFGNYVADPTIPSSQQFTPLTTGLGNAVRITTQIQAPYILGGIFKLIPSAAAATSSNSTTNSATTGSSCASTSTATSCNSSGAPAAGGGGIQQSGFVTIGATATAAQNSLASFAIGSGLASVNKGVLNAVLGGLVGGNLSLSVMDYQSLISANIDLFAFSNALATRAQLTGVTYNQLARGSFSVGTIMGAVVDTASVNPQNSAGVISALTQIASAATGNAASVSIAPLLNYGPYGTTAVGSSAPITAMISALDLVSAIAQLSNGVHQIQAALNLNIPGIASASLDLAIGERPVGTSFVAIGSTGASVHTAQTRLLLTVQLAATGQSSLVNLPIYIELASGTAQLTGIQCNPSNMAAATVTLGVTPAIIDAWIGDVSMSDFTNMSTAPNPGPATLLNVANLATVSGLANATMTNLSATAVTFTYADIQALTKQTTSTTDFISSLLSNLFGNLQLTATAAGLGLGLPTGLTQTVGQTLAAATSPIDQLLTSILQTLGVELGQADTWVSGVSCGSAVLVN